MFLRQRAQKLHWSETYGRLPQGDSIFFTFANTTHLLFNSSFFFHFETLGGNFYRTERKIDGKFTSNVFILFGEGGEDASELI